MSLTPIQLGKLNDKQYREALRLIKVYLGENEKYLIRVNDVTQTILIQYMDSEGYIKRVDKLKLDNTINNKLYFTTPSLTALIYKGSKKIAELTKGQVTELIAQSTDKALSTGQVITKAIRDKEKIPYIDELKLSDRVWNVANSDIKAQIQNTITRGIATNKPVKQISKELEGYLLNTGGAKFKTERLVFSELMQTRDNAMLETGKQLDNRYKTFDIYFKWQLSPAHEKPDVCDYLASYNNGIYTPNNVPFRPHPLCKCMIIPLSKPTYRKVEFNEYYGMHTETMIGNTPEKEILKGKQLIRASKSRI